MLLYPLKLLLRHLARSRTFSFINLLGLTIGLASCILISLYVYQQLSFDRFHPDHARIYRVNKITDEKGKQAQLHGITPGQLAPAAAKEIPQVTAACRYRPWFNDMLIGYDTVHLKLPDVAYADQPFLDMFNFPLIRGNRNTALSEPFTAVITESAARRLFRDKDPMGKTLITLNNIPVKITGLAKDVPDNSSLPFTMLISWPTTSAPATANYYSWMNNWLTQVDFTFVKLAPAADPKETGNRISALLHQHLPEREYEYTPYLQPLDEIHLHSARILYADYFHTNNGTIVYALAAVAAFILLIACFNFINLSTAGALRRARETGVHKVLGATRFQLIRNSFLESAGLCTIALTIAVLLTMILFPAFNSLAGSTLTPHLLIKPEVVAGLATLLLLVSLLAGGYPAFFLSRFRSADVFRNTIKAGKDSWLRKSLVTTQFSLSILLIIVTAVVQKQVNYLTTKDLGFDKEQLVIVQLTNTEVEHKSKEFINALNRDPAILSVTTTNRVPGQSFNGYGVVPEGFRLEDHLMASVLETDAGFASTYGIKMTKGRFFSPRLPTDTNTAIVINEAMANYLHWKDPVGKKFEIYEETKGQIIGVMQDFNFASLRENIQPLAIMLRNNPLWLSVRIRGSSTASALQTLTKTWQQFDKQEPIDYSFIDEELNRYYQADSRLLTILGIFSTLAIGIACLGLFGISIYQAQQRTKEIGIRKVLGAGIPDIIALITGNLVKLLLLAALIAFPLAGWAISAWMQDFAYRTPIGWWIYPAGGGLVLLIALGTVGFQAARAATANPVNSLRNE
ncbi:MAG TPA: ABC transporter permease [Puia sp.]|jgi:putative ABC transport system permease protein|nr:ABC transporter permease [Puia sp.]